MDKQKPYNATKKVCIKLSKSIAEEKLCDNESDYIKSYNCRPVMENVRARQDTVYSFLIKHHLSMLVENKRISFLAVV